MLRLRLAVLVARIIRAITRLAGRGGTALPGLVAQRIAPDLVERLTRTIPGGVVVVTGTNGKTTTAKMIATALRGEGRKVLANRTGSNLERGLAAELAGASRRGRVDADVAVFEIDEAAVRALGPRLRPDLIVVTNLARDQLDRYGELETTARHVAGAVAASRSAVLSADDPMVAGLASSCPGEVVWFGAVPDLRRAMPDDRSLYGTGTGAASQEIGALITGWEARGEGGEARVEVGGDRVTVSLQVPGIYNAYNAAAALLAASRLGVAPGRAAAHLAGMAPAFGRGQVVEYRGRRVKVVLVKNPAGLNQAIRLLVDESRPSAVLVAINDHHADGRDVSWLWDAAVESLAATPHRFGAGGVRAADMAVRLKYAGVGAWVEPDAAASLDRLVADAGPGETVYLIPTYTALLEYLELLLPDRDRSEVWS